jgi:hypothetical protein
VTAAPVAPSSSAPPAATPPAASSGPIEIRVPDIGDFDEVPFDPDTLQNLKVDVSGIREGVKKEVIVDGQKFENTEAAIKFLVDQNGNVLTRYASTTSPSDIARDIEKLLTPEA